MARLESVFHHVPLHSLVPICIPCNNKRIDSETPTRPYWEPPEYDASQHGDLRPIPPCDAITKENEYHGIIGNMDSRTSRCSECRARTHDGAHYCGSCALRRECCHRCGSRWRPLVYLGDSGMLPPGAPDPNGWGNWIKSFLFCTWPRNEYSRFQPRIQVSSRASSPSWLARFCGMEGILDKLTRIEDRLGTLEFSSSHGVCIEI